MTSLPEDYRERVYAGWLGKCAGVRLGAPVEGWWFQDIQNHLGAIDDYLPLPPGKVFKPDDDTAAPLIYIRALEDYGPGVTPAQIGDTLLNYLGDQHGVFWWGGYGVSTEHTAYLNLLAGIPAPRSGSIELNGAAVAEQIGGQIFSDIWGLAAPNDPALAADYAERASSVSHGGNAVYGGRFVAACVSAAFGLADPCKIVEAGLSVIPAESEYARVVRAVRDFHLANPQDWKACCRMLHTDFGYDRYPGPVHVIPNAGILVMSLLYGEGSFSRAIQIAVEGGWDTDCNAGNAGAIMGVAVGLNGIDARWRQPMNDLQVNAGVIGCRNLIDIPACADLFVRLGRQIAGLTPEPRGARCHFDYPGATHGFGGSAAFGNLVDIRNLPAPGRRGRALRYTVKRLERFGELRMSLPIYYAPNDLSANFYGASFSPKVYPGQTLHAWLYLPPDSPQGLSAALYAQSSIIKESLQAVGCTLKAGEWTELSFTLPAGSLNVTEVGVTLRHQMDAPWSGSVWIDDLDWGGPVDYAIDFRSARPEYGAASGWTYLRGLWRLEDGLYHGSGCGVNESYTGDVAWGDQDFEMRLTPIAGDTHLIAARVQGALRSYAFGLAGKGRLALFKNAHGYRRLVETDFDWQMGLAYTLRLACRGSRLTAAVDGSVIFEIEDTDRPYLSGEIGLVNFAGCHTRFEGGRVAAQ